MSVIRLKENCCILSFDNYKRDNQSRYNFYFKYID